MKRLHGLISRCQIRIIEGANDEFYKMSVLKHRAEIRSVIYTYGERAELTLRTFKLSVSCLL